MLKEIMIINQDTTEAWYLGELEQIFVSNAGIFVRCAMWEYPKLILSYGYYKQAQEAYRRMLEKIKEQEDLGFKNVAFIFPTRKEMEEVYPEPPEEFRKPLKKMTSPV